MRTLPDKLQLPYDKKDAVSIYDYSKGLLHHCLRPFVWEGYVPKQGKGALGQMVENIYFFLETNSNPASDFSEAGLELKCTPLKHGTKEKYLIKERLVCNMIDYFELAKEDFEHSHFFLKCRLLLILFYLHQTDCDKLDLEFIYSVLWQLPEKDLLIIRHDYEVIRSKVLHGDAHLLSEGDTEYLGACRKGQKADPPTSQPFSDMPAPKRAFSLKPSYMRTILQYIQVRNTDAVSNYTYEVTDHQLVNSEQLLSQSFEEIILGKLNAHKGKNYRDLCEQLGRSYDTDKGKYAHIASKLIDPSIGNVNLSEEFKKAGLQLKTIRIEDDGSIKESMSFENIDYQEVFDNDTWTDSRLYEIFSGRFLFVIFKPDGGEITYINRRGDKVHERTYGLDRAFFWTMPQEDLLVAEEYWENIRQCVVRNHIAPKYFFKISDHKHFHVRPKARLAIDLAVNPNGGYARKYCYWFNNEYIQKIERENR